MSSNEWDRFPLIAAAGAAAFVGVSLAYLAWSASRPASSVPRPVFGGSRGVAAGDVPSDVIRRMMEELRPLHTLYLDVAEAQRAVLNAWLYSGIPSVRTEEIDRAKRVIRDQVMLDLFKADSAGFMTDDEIEYISNELRGVIEDLNSNRFTDAARTMTDLENLLAEKLYRWVGVQFKLKGY